MIRDQRLRSRGKDGRNLPATSKDDWGCPEDRADVRRAIVFAAKHGVLIENIPTFVCYYLHNYDGWYLERINRAWERRVDRTYSWNRNRKANHMIDTNRGAWLVRACNEYDDED